MAIDLEAKLQELEALKAQVERLENEITTARSGPGWRATGYYSAYYATAGFLLGSLGAIVSLLFNVVCASLAGKSPLELIRVYLTFPLGEKALQLTQGQNTYAVNDRVILAFGCCLYLATGMLLGIPIYMALARFAASWGPDQAAGCGEHRLAPDLGDHVLRDPLVVAAAAGGGRPRQLDHQHPPRLSSRGGSPRPRILFSAGPLPCSIHSGNTVRIGGSPNRPPEPTQRGAGAWSRPFVDVFLTVLVDSHQSEETTLEKELPRHADLVDERLVYWHFMAALIFMGASMLGGLLMALQLLRLNPFTGIELLSPGRWRMIHTNAIAYGFIANAFLGVLQWVVPRLTLRKVYNPKIPGLNIGLSWAIFWAWQLVVGATAVGLLLGQAQAVEWGETPIWIDPVAQLGLLLVAINYIPPIAKVEGPLYVSLWYFLAAFVWTFLTYAMGNFMPQYFVTGTAAGAVGGLFIHDLVGLFVTPLGWGLMYYFVPILLKKPIWSHGLSLVGFWGLAFFYPLQGIHHFLYTPIPMFLAVRGGDLDHRRRAGGRDASSSIFTRPCGARPGADHEPADPLVL